MNKELGFVKEMFDNIAPRYDFLNRLLSLRQDVYWRKEMVKAANLPEKSTVLDVACGTCDVALEINNQKGETCKIFGVDFSFGMIKLGKNKLDQVKKRSFIKLVNGDALSLPFKYNEFNAVFTAFGIRNIMNRKKAIKEFYNSLKPEGKLAVLELTTPEKGVLKTLYFIYFKKILPLIGSFFSKHQDAYHYLPESVINFPTAVEFSKLMTEQGLENVKYKQMTFGIVTLFVGTRKA